MANKTLIKKYLPEELWDIAAQYSIPDEFIEDMPELIAMILRSRSIDTEEEKQNWFNLLPLMNDTQLDKLRAILDKEKNKLAEIENKYEQKKLEIKKKYLMKRQEMGYVKQIASVREEESTHMEQDKEDAEELLNSL